MAEQAPDGEPVTVFLYDFGTDKPFTAASQVPPNDIIELSGGVNVFGDVEARWTEVTWEAVVDAEPEVIMILEYNDQPAQDKIDFLRSNPTTAGLPAVVGLLPFTVFSTFLVAIAGDASADEAFVGTLRGLGGVAALVTGLAVAPLLARWRSPRTAAVGLVLLSVAALAGCVATVPALVVFCLGVGAATAVLTPALLHVATASFAARADGARAATLVTAFQSLGAVLAGPVIGALAWWLGWRGVLLMTSVLALVLAAGLLRSSSVTTAARAPAAGYRQAWSRLRSRPDLVGEAFTLVWTLSGTSFWSSPRPGSSSP